MRLRTVLVSAVVLAAMAGAGLIVFANVHQSGASDTTTSSDDPSSLKLATVAQRDIARTTTLDGTVTHGTPTPLPISGNGTLTRLPVVGSRVASGQMLVEVDGLPVVLLHGDRPAWRDLGSGVDDGEDIRQLEQALADLGDAGSGLTVDDEWTSATTTAVKKLQKALGMDDDGRLQLGEVVFAPSTVRIDSVGGHLGDAADAAAVKVTGELQLVEATAKPSYSDIVAPATTVDIELPSGRHVAGVVYSVGAPTTDSQGTTTLPVTVVVAEGETLDAVDGLAVDVNVSVVAVPGATAVPAAALLALAEGGYAVEVPDASTAGGTRLVGVELGSFDEDGWVQITGDVKPGDQVVVP